MDVVPATRVTRFEQLEPGDFFLYLDGKERHFALKTAKPANGDRSSMVLLGPTFLSGVAESLLVEWRPAAVLSFGKSCTILLPSDPVLWSTSGPSRVPVCLAITGNDTLICANGGECPHRYFPCFVNVKSGEIVEGRLPDSVAYTNTWEIATLGTSHPPRTILKYPLEATGASV